MLENLKRHWILIGILAIGLIVGLYNLDSLPADMWDDAVAHYILTDQVRHGNFFIDYRYGGDGPVYTYLVVLVSWFFGLSFYTLKLTSVFIYLLFIFVMYLLTDALFTKKDMAYTASFVAAVSFWSIMFARQPHARILVPFFIALTLLFAAKKKTFISGLFLGLGMYTQASFWAMPLIFFKRYKILLIGLLIAIPLGISFAKGNVGFFSNSSYFGEKLATTSHLSFAETLPILFHNALANFLSFALRGDRVFRLNVPNSPHLDIVSAIFFFVGFLLLIYKTIKEKNEKIFQFIILPFFIIQIPSILDIHNPLAQPNIGRMIGVIPFVYMSTAYGLTTVLHFVLKNYSFKKIFYSLCLCSLLIIIAIFNIDKYFLLFPKTLPNNNTPFWRTIAKTIDSYPSKKTFLMIGPGWRTSYQREREMSVQLSITKPHTFQTIQSGTLCSTIQQTQNVIIIADPTDKITEATLTTCGKQTHEYLLKKNGYEVANFIEIK